MADSAKPWSVNQLAEAAGVTPVYVRKLCQAGEVDRAFKLGRAWLIPAESAEAWVAKRRERWEKF